MVEVIERGEKPADKVFKTWCRTCQSQLSFRRSEARLQDDRLESFLIITCPVCEEPVWVKC